MDANNDFSLGGSSSVLQSTAGGVVALLKTTRKHWMMVVALAALGGTGSFLQAHAQPKIYQTHVMLELDPDVVRPLGDKNEDQLSLGAGGWDAREYYETQYRLMVADRVLGKVVTDLSLLADPDFGGVKTGSPTVQQMQGAIGALRSHLVIEPIKLSRLVMVTEEDRDPKRAVRIADAVARTFVEENLSSAIASTSDAVVWLNGQLDSVRQELELSENALHTFKQKYELPSTSINEASNMYRLELQSYGEALTKTRTAMQTSAAKESVLAAVATGEPDSVPASDLFSSAYFKLLREKYLAVVQEKHDLIAEGKAENHPLVKRAADRANDLRAAMLAEVANIREGVQNDLEVVRKAEAGETALYEEARRRAIDLNMKEIEYHRLDRSREQNEKVYAYLLERLKGADLARMMRVNNVRIVDPAIEPTRPIRPVIPTRTGLGFLVGLLLGVGLAWLRDQLDASLKTSSDVESKLGLTFLGLLPALAPEDRRGYRKKAKRKSASRRTGPEELGYPAELLAHARPLSTTAEAARTIRTNLVFSSPDKPFRSLLVSSAAPSEGKTTVACSLAIAFAQGGQRTCIIDCDLRRPRLHRIFGRVGDEGVTNVLVGEATIEQVAKPTAVPNLWSIPAGPLPPSAADMLQSARFRRFIEELTQHFDRIIIDSPPLVPVTDAAIMSKLVDGTVFVVRSYATSVHLSLQGLRSLRDVGATLVGGVLNWVDFDKHEYASGEYYHYAYYKRQTYGSDNPPPPGGGAAQGATS